MQHPHWLCYWVCPFPLFQKWFYLARIFSFSSKSWRNQIKKTHGRDSERAPSSGTRSRHIQNERAKRSQPKTDTLFWCMCLCVQYVCWFLFYFNFFFIVEFRGRISCFFFSLLQLFPFFHHFILKSNSLSCFWGCSGLAVFFFNAIASDVVVFG